MLCVSVSNVKETSRNETKTFKESEIQVQLEPSSLVILIQHLLCFAYLQLGKNDTISFQDLFHFGKFTFALHVNTIMSMSRR